MIALEKRNTLRAHRLHQAGRMLVIGGARRTTGATAELAAHLLQALHNRQHLNELLVLELMQFGAGQKHTALGLNIVPQADLAAAEFLLRVLVERWTLGAAGRWV